MHPAVTSAVRTLLSWIGLPWILLLLALRLDLVAGFEPVPVVVRVIMVMPGLLGAFLARWAQLQRQLLGHRVSGNRRETGARRWLFGGGGDDRYLHTSGPYLLCRHPLYWGASLYLLGCDSHLVGNGYAMSFKHRVFIYR